MHDTPNHFWNTKVVIDEPLIEKDVVIIGAGCAGLECAQKLYTQGIENIVVLEAQDYMGGRMKTEFIDDDECKPLEMGANWIHGTWGNPLYKLVQENGGIFHHKKQTLFCDVIVSFIDEHGRELDPLMCHSFYALYKSWQSDAACIWRQNLRTTYENYAEYMYAKLADHTKNDTVEFKKIKYALMRRLLIAETVESGSINMEEVSLNEYGSYHIPIGPDYEFPGGYSALIDFLADKLPKDTVKLSCPVKHITFAEKRKKHENESSARMLVECYNGVKYKAEHVVVTVSSSYLAKNYESLFCPSLLNDNKINAINSIKMDTVDKIFLFYDDLSFFPAQVESLHPIFMDTDKEFGPHMETNWVTKLSSINRFYDNVLLLWITGKEAHFIEKLDNTIIAEQLTQMLRRLLGDKNVPMPNKVLKTYWHSNPYICGSYSYIDKHSKSARTDIGNLAEPIYVDNIPRICFAGEATHLTHYSTVHGAYLTGQREAQRILNYQGNDKLILKTRSRI